MKKESVSLQASTDAVDSNGNVQQTWATVKTLTGTFIPQADFIQWGNTGFTETVEELFCTKTKSPDIVNGNRIVSGDKVLYISKIADYGKAIILGCDSYVKTAVGG